MNHLATSKEDILAASRDLIKENGWAAVSIRAVASRCSVSAGTIYNYYESKADLLSDTIESIWHEIFFHPEDEQIFHDVESCISWIYERLEYGNRQFPGFFSLHSFGFMRDEKTSGKKRMMKTKISQKQKSLNRMKLTRKKLLLKRLKSLSLQSTKILKIKVRQCISIQTNQKQV